ncbi:helix-turn-helix domain-containing protein [Roseibium sp. RKSG952]|uniref:helix-turn-helix domain-containing protein n=1 Tax=Roseibium sp. RKSG952 TaxID=2529384 RepID=UPI0012BC8183|nr:helix-turn-helix domain-containing protein [Roseibium sp. RKSG952]MTH97287.1 chromosomal replication initiator DnaA [Roseibium sp. RKSG952]
MQRVGNSRRNRKAARNTNPLKRLRDSRVAAHLHLAEAYVSLAYCVPPLDFFGKGRGAKHVCEGRQLLMYLAHVEFGLSLADVARRYKKDRSTAHYACRRIEDRRDDPCFDGMVSEIETLVTLKDDPVFSFGKKECA